MSKCAIWGLSCAVAALAGCGNPYAVKVHDVDYRKTAIDADIMISDIKLYRREALISERREEVAYLNKQLLASETLVFAPEFVRDLEAITALSAAVGLRFDAGAKENYLNSREIADTEQDIRLLRLQAELDQLGRNVELLRAALPLQTEGSDDTLGDTSTLSTTQPTSTVTAAASQLTAAIAALQTTLQTRLDATTTGPRATTVSVNPNDLYFDRAAHRSLLNQARNQANLDELHDVDGAALLRLSFAANLPPAPKNYNATYGELSLWVVGPEWNAQDLAKAYRQWLDYVNTELVQDQGFIIALSLQKDLFKTATFYYSDKGAPGCHGLGGMDAGADCQAVKLAAPRYSYFDPNDVSAASALAADTTSRSVDTNAVQKLSSALAAMKKSDRCDLVRRWASGEKGISPDIEKGVPHAANYVATTWAIGDYTNLILSLEVQAARGLQRRSVIPRYSSAVSMLREYGHFEPLAELLFADRCEPVEKVPRRFAAAVRGDRDPISVYNLEPREVVQQLSTTARAAEAVALAAAVSAAVPASGAAGDANFGFTRSATGKVDARERVPLVLAFAQAKDATNEEARTDAFGWRFGPRVVLDAPNKALRLEHHPRSYDLSANVVVPGWWPYVTVESQGRWSPYAKNAADLKSEKRKTRLRLSPNVADYNALTARLTGASLLRYPAAKIEGDAQISVCTDSNLEIRGVNLWKATAVMVGGRIYDGASLNLSPDMGGIVVTTKKQTEPFPVAPIDAHIPVRVLTPLGSVKADKSLRLNNALADGRCDTPPEPKKLAAGPTIEVVDPDSMSTCSPNPAFSIGGTKIDGAIEVSLGSAQGVIVRQATEADPVARVTFTTAQLRTEFAGIAKPKLVLRFPKGGRAEKEVQLVSPATCTQ